MEDTGLSRQQSEEIETAIQAKETETNNEAIKKEEFELKSLAQYNKELSKHLPKSLTKRQPKRVLWMAFFVGVTASIVYAGINLELAWYTKLILGALMGMANAGGAFICHEVLHGSVVKNRKLQNFIGFFGFAPYLISPTYWRFWHNRLHHGNTQLLYKDPDAFPTRMVWKKSKFMKWAFPFTPGSGHKRSIFYFFWWFSFQAVLNQFYMRFGNKMWAKMDHNKVSFEFGIQVIMLAGFLTLVGPANWWWLAVIPFMIQNYTVMSYISTNHNLSPYTRVNDPLVNSLSVTNNKVLEFFHLNFGYHTEHHLFPSMPMSNAKMVSNKLRELYPDRYMIMEKSKAVKMLYSTPRIYKNREVLVNPETGAEFPTIKNEKRETALN